MDNIDPKILAEAVNAVGYKRYPGRMDPENYLHEKTLVGRCINGIQQCGSLVQDYAPWLGHDPEWKPGEKLLDMDAHGHIVKAHAIPVGTPIATFHDGQYGGLVRGQSHTSIFMYFAKKGDDTNPKAFVPWDPTHDATDKIIGAVVIQQVPLHFHGHGEHLQKPEAVLVHIGNGYLDNIEVYSTIADPREHHPVKHQPIHEAHHPSEAPHHPHHRHHRHHHHHKHHPAQGHGGDHSR